jgi:thiamine pyrophosphate-dependent acetolactate synthase large subunit-like protein
MLSDFLPPRRKEAGDKASSKKGIDRRAFLGATAGVAGAAVGAAAGAASAAVTDETSRLAPAPQADVKLAGPSLAQLDRDAGTATPPAITGNEKPVKRPGSDLMVQVLRDLGIEYIAANPGSSFEGLQESLVNYGETPNVKPEFITCLHEESATDMAHGYGKAQGVPMAVLLHGTVGMLHASMAVYQAFNDQTPILMIAGRDDHFIQAHTANDMAGALRSFTKWDAQPKTLAETLTTLQEAYRQAITPPRGPVLVVIDTDVQKEEAGDMQVPKYQPPRIASIDEMTAREIAKGLVNARNPRLEVGKLRTPEGVQQAVELAELLGCSVSTMAMRAPMSFPHPHPLCGPGADTKYDYGLGLESDADSVSIIGPSMKTVNKERDVTKIGWGDMREGPGRMGQQPRKPRAKQKITTDAEASLPLIIEQVKMQLTSDQKSRIADRTAKHAEANHQHNIKSLKDALELKKVGWHRTPVTTARMYADLWPLIKDSDWCLSSPSSFSGNHHVDLWTHQKHYSYLGDQGAGGIGYSIGASMGAGLAAKHRDRIVIDINGDGDINYAPGSLWTAAHHQLPVLVIVHNNRAWNMELMFLEYMCGVRGRRTDRASIGTTLRDPDLQYAKMAECYGVESEGPISDPEKLDAAYKRGIAAVKSGRPYLIDVVSEPR